MSKYEVTVGGKTWICDTLAEARACEAKAKRAAQGRVRNGGAPSDSELPRLSKALRAATLEAIRLTSRAPAARNLSEEEAALTKITKAANALKKAAEAGRWSDDSITTSDALAQIRSSEAYVTQMRAALSTVNSDAAIADLRRQANNLLHSIQNKQHGAEYNLTSAAYRLNTAVNNQRSRGRDMREILEEAMAAVRAALATKRPRTKPPLPHETERRRAAHTEHAANLHEQTDEFDDTNSVYVEKLVDISDLFENMEGSDDFSDWNYVSGPAHDEREVTIKGRVKLGSATAAEVADAQMSLTLNPRYKRAKRRNPDSTLPPSPLLVKRPVGEENTYKRKAYSKYLFTMVSPKCNVPVEFFSNNSYKFAGFAPNGTLYGDGYFGDTEKGCVRQHMYDGLANVYQDTGTGVGAALYMAGPVAAFAEYGKTCTFSPDVAPRHDGDTNERKAGATRAWRNLVEKGTAEEIDGDDDDYDEDREDTPESKVVDLSDYIVAGANYIVAGKGDFTDWVQIDSIEPERVTVHGYSDPPEQSNSRSETYQMLKLSKIMSMGIVLDCEPALWEAIEGEENTTSAVPPAKVWAMLDLGATTADRLNKYLEFCAEASGYKAAYKAAAMAALAHNPSTPEGFAAPVQNPRRRLSASTHVDKKTEKWLKRMKDPTWGDIL